MRLLKTIINFFKDFNQTKKDPFHSSKNSTYTLMRFLYKISDGLILFLISKFLFKSTKKPSNFNNGFKITEALTKENTENLKEEILKMKIKTINSKNTSENYLKLKNNEIDFKYYHQNKITKINFDNSELLKNELITKYATDKKWINICEDILGSKAYLTGITSWLTLPANFVNGTDYDEIKNYESSQMWHRDCDYLRDIKVMTYLTDVIDENDGPFEIIKDTHSFNFFNPFIYEMGLAMRVNNNYINKNFKHKIHSFCGNKGTTYVVDTRNLHRGKTIKKSNHHRLTLQLYFTNSLFGNQIINPKLSKDWDSYHVWKNALNNNNSYKTLFSD